MVLREGGVVVGWFCWLWGGWVGGGWGGCGWVGVGVGGCGAPRAHAIQVSVGRSRPPHKAAAAERHGGGRARAVGKVPGWRVGGLWGRGGGVGARGWVGGVGARRRPPRGHTRTGFRRSYDRTASRRSLNPRLLGNGVVGEGGGWGGPCPCGGEGGGGVAWAGAGRGTKTKEPQPQRKAYPLLAHALRRSRESGDNAHKLQGHGRAWGGRQPPVRCWGKGLATDREGAEEENTKGKKHKPRKHATRRRQRRQQSCSLSLKCSLLCGPEPSVHRRGVEKG